MNKSTLSSKKARKSGGLLSVLIYVLIMLGLNLSGFDLGLVPLVQAKKDEHLFGGWQDFTDSQLGLSIKYPENWIMHEDPTFRKPIITPGAIERRVTFSSSLDPLFGMSIPATGSCRLDLLISDASIDTLKPIPHEDLGKQQESRWVTLQNGLELYDISYESIELDQYEYHEYYLPYENGTIVLISWTTNYGAIRECDPTFSQMITSLKANLPRQKPWAINIPFSHTQMSGQIPRVLELPFRGLELIQQGWIYSYSSNKHEGIDYIQGVINQSRTWVNFDVLAAAEGDATYIGYKSGWGDTVVVKHTIDGQIYYTLYAHLDSWTVPGSNAWDHVMAGQKIGVAGKSGSGSGNVTHLHFEVSHTSYGSGYRDDPYDLRNVRNYYPGWDKYTGLGSNHSWRTEPAHEPIGVTVYEDINYGGRSWILTQSDEDLCDNIISGTTTNPNPCFDPNVITWNDRISSIKLSPGYRAILLLHSKDWDIDQYGQAQSRFNCGQDIPDFTQLTFAGTKISLNDNVSKVIVAKCTSTGIVQGQSLTSTYDPCSPESPPSTNDSASFVSDITLPDDGPPVTPGASLIKTWRMKNTGSTTWGSGYQLVFKHGDQMGAPATVNVPITSPNQEIDLGVNMTAPTSSANYVGYWQLRNPQGTYFGPEIWVQVTVQPGFPSPVGDITLTCFDCPSVLSPGQTYRPIIRAEVNTGQLLGIGIRGDHLLNTDGNLFGAHILVAVPEYTVVNAGETHDFVFYEDALITAPSSEGTYESKWRVWRDGNWAGQEITIRFDVRQANSNHRPNAPSPKEPANWFADISPPLLQAQDNGDPDGDPITGYYFEVAGNGDWSSPDWNSGWTASSTTPSGLLAGWYQWRVKVKDDNGGESDWSEVWNFNLNSTVLTVASLEFLPTSPSNGERIRVYTCVDGYGGTNLGLKIEANTATDGTANGDWYWIHHLGAICYDHSNPDTWPTWETLPLEDGVHLVRAVGTHWDEQKAVYATYTLQRRKPPSPHLLSPEHNTWVNSRQVTFRWDPAPRTASYHLLVSASGDPATDPIVDQMLDANTTSYTANFSDDYPDLNWRVIASNELGWSEATKHFGIDRAVSVSAVNVLPSATYESVFSVNWSGTDDRSGLRWYDIQYRDGNRPESEWVDWMTNVMSIASIFIGQPGHTYYFRSRALDVAGNLEDWPVGDGDTFTTIDPSALPPTPWWDSSFNYKRNLLVQNNDGHVLPIGYPIHVHFDTGTNPSSTELFAASQSSVKGDDFRIVYNNTTELTRFIQAFDSNQIDIWFNLQAQIASNPGSDNTSYQLYYANPLASSPPGDPNSVFSPVVDSNTVGLWRLFDGSGNTVIDSSGHGHHGTASNMGWSQGKFGWSGTFNGVNSLVNLGDSDQFNLSQFTVEAWVYIIAHQGETTIFRKDASDTSLIYDVLMDYNRVVLRLNGNSCNVVGNTELQTGRWYHMAWTYDGSTVRVYLNNRLDGSSYCGNPLRTGHTPLWMGGDGNTYHNILNGYLQLTQISSVVRDSFPYGEYGDILNEPSSAAGDVIVPPVAGAPDLVVLALASYPNLDGGILVQAYVQNQGPVSTKNGFYTDLYANHLPVCAGDYTGNLLFWVNDSIAAGEIVTLTTVLNSLPNQGLMALTTGSEITATLYAQVDSTGVISESNKANNILSNGMQVCIANSDAYISDNTPSNATLITVGETQSHNFSSMGDKDWVKFYADEGIKYRLSTANLGVSADTYLYLYDRNGTILLASNDDVNGTLASDIVWTAPETGTYYALIQHWNPVVGGCGTGYDLSLAIIYPPLPTDSYIYLPVLVR